MKPRHSSHHLKAPDLVALSTALCVLASASVQSCPYSIRQSGFVVLKKQPYHVYCFVNDKTPGKDELSTAVNDARYVLRDTNVEAEVVNVDRQLDHDAMIHYYQLAPDKLPVLALVSPKEEVTRLGGAALSPDNVEAVLEGVVSSPKRDEMMEHIVKQWCVVLLVKGADAADNHRALTEAKASVKDIKGKPAEMVLSIDDPPHLLVVDAKDPQERIFLWSLGLTGDDPPKAKAVVLFGRGRQVGPVLEGSNLNRTSLSNIFFKIGSNCSCTSDPIWISGRFVPLRWDDLCRREVRRLAGFDPDSMRVRSEMARVWNKDLETGQSGGFLGYVEGYFEADGETGAETMTVPFVAPPTAAPRRDKSSADEPVSALEHRAAHMLVIVVTGMAAAVALAGGLLAWGRRRS